MDIGYLCTALEEEVSGFYHHRPRQVRIDWRKVCGCLMMSECLLLLFVGETLANHQQHVRRGCGAGHAARHRHLHQQHLARHLHRFVRAGGRVHQYGDGSCTI